MSGTGIGFTENLRDAVRGNPLAAALIGAGALWLLLGNERLKRAVSSVSAATAPTADIGANRRSKAPKFTNSPRTAPEMDHGSSQHAGATLSRGDERRFRRGIGRCGRDQGPVRGRRHLRAGEFQQGH
jgi:hypothetical protein